MKTRAAEIYLGHDPQHHIQHTIQKTTMGNDEVIPLGKVDQLLNYLSCTPVDVPVALACLTNLIKRGSNILVRGVVRRLHQGVARPIPQYRSPATGR